MTDAGKEELTHIAWATRRTGKNRSVLLECGKGRIDPATGVAHVYLDRTPLNGFTGYVQLAPRGVTPELPFARPRRPEQLDDEEE